jgi:hypothetical protein
MKKVRITYSILISLALLMSSVAGALASPAAETVPACSGETVSGTVVAVDAATNTITIDTGAGLCAVTLGGSYDHPIVQLLGQRFSNVSLDDFTQEVLDQLQHLNACAVPNTDGSGYNWVACGSDPAAVPVVILSANPDGTFTVKLADGSTAVLSVSDAAALLNIQAGLAAKESLTVNWNILDGLVLDGEAQVNYYHEMGIGFGVLVKLYSLAEANGLPVDEMVQAFLSGQGIGQLKKIYGRPQYMGIGQLRKEVKAGLTNGSDDPNNPGGNDKIKDKDKGKNKDKDKGKPPKPPKPPKPNKVKNEDNGKKVCANPNANPKAKSKCP